MHEFLDFGLKVLGGLLVTGITAFFAWLGLHTRLGRGYRKARTCLNRARALRDVDQFEQARVEVERAVSILEDEERDRLLVEAYLDLGDLQSKLGNWQEAIRSYVLCRESAAKTKSGIAAEVLLLRLGRVYEEAGQLEEAFKCFDEARQMQGRVSGNPLLAETDARLGEVEGKRGHFEVAIEHFLRALTTQERLRDRRSLAATHVSLAELYTRKGETREAGNHYGAAVHFYRAVGDTAVARVLEAKIVRSES